MILNRRIRGLELIHFLVQISCAFLLYLAWLNLPWGLADAPSWTGLRNYTMYGVVCLTGLTTCYWVTRGRLLLEASTLQNVRWTMQQVLTVCLFIAMFLTGTKDQAISRVFLFSYLIALGVVLFATNARVPDLIGRIFFRASHEENTLTVGRRRWTTETGRWIEGKRGYGINVIDSIATEDFLGGSDEECKGLLQHARTLVTQHGIRIICFESPSICGHFRELSAFCEQLGLRPLVIADWQELGRRAVMCEDSGRTIVSPLEEPLQCPWNRALKRLFDLAVSIPIVLFLLPPVALAVALAQKAQAPGPLLFRQKRTGANGRVFEIYKFRTMEVDHRNETQQASEGDPRIFAFGRGMRRRSLDELPQFINVLRGDMSVVGPRPHLREHDEIFSEYARWYRFRQLVKPGITGLAQVHGYRGEAKTPEDVSRRVEADLRYLEKWSLAMDCRILLHTIWQVLFPPRRAY